ncbi:MULTISPECIES: DUF6457 domain-containing protein [unclassified Microbacterium]|uniref:DUF6457 domain-containing protein n=1 Tax=unclassified Microbacterium TaxID=2609290 RepID=UPI000EA9E996|nr:MULTISPECIES: DUF6457 domain-containing protein [unclassified Microbacterium]MBT2484478.1 hypothetical protein [Microbacterium sp. ISL-108]RKN67384.1 hypothetical protein D7252_07185 [Microbacterium sp. CGR2]
MVDAPDELSAWVEGLAVALGVEGEVPVDDLLNLTREAAHGVTRPAGPLTTYLVGRAVAQGTPLAEAIVIARAHIG